MRTENKYQSCLFWNEMYNRAFATLIIWTDKLCQQTAKHTSSQLPNHTFSTSYIVL